MSLHLLHHIADGIKEQGPVHSWSMYVYERFNSWICQRAMNRLHPEATVMETYRVSYYHYRLFFNFMTILYKINGTVKTLNTLVALRQICLAVVDGFPEQAKNVAIVDGMVDVNVRFECSAQPMSQYMRVRNQMIKQPAFWVEVNAFFNNNWIRVHRKLLYDSLIELLHLWNV